MSRTLIGPTKSTGHSFENEFAQTPNRANLQFSNHFSFTSLQKDENQRLEPFEILSPAADSVGKIFLLLLSVKRCV